MPKITDINCETGEVVERDMTAEELAAYEIMIAQANAMEGNK